MTVELFAFTVALSLAILGPLVFLMYKISKRIEESQHRREAAAASGDAPRTLVRYGRQ